MEEILKINNLSVEYRAGGSVAHAVNELNLSVGKGEAVGLVGESGAGKTTAVLSILGLLPDKIGKITNGEVMFGGQVLTGMPERRLNEIRGGKIAMVFANPLSSLNPVFTVGHQIEMVVKKHRRLTKAAARAEAEKILRLVGIPAYRLDDYPHQFSGGMRQRVGIAAALVCSPELLIADEPTTALDVTIQAQILELMKELQREYSSSLLMITHSLGIIAELCQKVAVMYAGSVVEFGSVKDVFTNPLHAYTRGLIGAIPKLTGNRERLESIPGNVANAEMLPGGCCFHPRCSRALPMCAKEIPRQKDTGGGHRVSCHKYGGDSRV